MSDEIKVRTDDFRKSLSFWVPACDLFALFAFYFIKFRIFATLSLKLTVL